jgi:hypothetical protein
VQELPLGKVALKVRRAARMSTSGGMIKEKFAFRTVPGLFPLAGFCSGPFQQAVKKSGRDPEGTTRFCTLGNAA